MKKSFKNYCDNVMYFGGTLIVLGAGIISLTFALAMIRMWFQ